MECKVIRESVNFISTTVLIETLWNVKLYKVTPPALTDIVLIETLWNVKEYSNTDKDVKAFVLIETLWNVKTFLRLCNFAVSGINRNIVECKVGYIFRGILSGCTY